MAVVVGRNPPPTISEEDPRPRDKRLPLLEEDQRPLDKRLLLLPEVPRRPRGKRLPLLVVPRPRGKRLLVLSLLIPAPMALGLGSFDFLTPFENK